MGQLLGFDFIKTRNVLKRGLELDGYNEELNLGFEFRGIQHYQYVSYFHKTIEGYQELIKRNYDKENQCVKKGIKLLIIPYWVEEESDESLIHFVKNWLTLNGIPFQKKEVSLQTINGLNFQNQNYEGTSSK